MDFWKMQGCGNDYVIVDDREMKIVNPEEMVRTISDRHFGVGSDGLILVRSSERANFAMKMYNADGTEAGMCGNGIRLVGKYVYDNNLTRENEITIETSSGIKELDLHVKDDKVDYVTVNMGEPITRAARIPVNASKPTMVEETLDIEDTPYAVTCIGMGNPHAVIFLDDVDNVDITRLGPLIENHERFPERTNVEFVQMLSENSMRMRVWERGSGMTMACGTGACASVAAAILTHRSNDEVTVRLDGGTLKVRYDRKNDRMLMTGPAVLAFRGCWLQDGIP